MSIPDVVVQFGFDSDASESVANTTWTDVSDWVAELPGGASGLIRTQRGKQYEFDEFQAGTLDLVLDNRDGRFSPDNTASPYWPDVKPMRRVRVLADGYLDTYSDAYGEPVFSGFVDQWPQQWLSHAAVQVSVAASDGFKVLHNVGLESSVYVLEIGEDGPEHWWRLGETSGGTTAVDIGSEPTAGTYSGSPTLDASGLVEHDSDTSVEFDGSNDRVTISEFAVPRGDNITVEAIIHPDALGTGTSDSTQLRRVVSGPVSPNEDARVSIGIDSDGRVHAGAFRALAGYANGSVQSSSGVISTGNTYHVALTLAPGPVLTLYVNGTAYTTTGTIRLKETSTSFLIGDSDDGMAFDGRIDEVAIYGEALSSTRILAHSDAVSAAWNGDLSGARVGRALDFADWPTADRDLDTGATTFQDASFADDDTVLGFVQRAAQSEYGYFYVGPGSDAKFIGRHNLLNETRYTTSQGTFSDQPTGSQLPYADLQLDPSSDATVINDWTVQRKFGTAQSASDPTSISAYFERSQSRTALMMDNDAEARAQAEWLLAHTKDPVTRIRRLTLDPAGNDDLWEQVLTRELMDRVTVNYRIPGGGSTSKEVHIIGIEHRISKGRWMCDWWLSPADTQSYLILDDATFGTLDDNRLGY